MDVQVTVLSLYSMWILVDTCLTQLVFICLCLAYSHIMLQLYLFFFLVNWKYPADSQPRLMDITFKVITTAWNGMEQLGGVLRSVGVGPLSIACGNAATDASDDNPIQAVSLLAVSIAEHFSDAARAIFGLAEVVLCRSFNPIYTSLAHNILCTDFINLVSPMLWCMFVISICSMVMITLRVAWYELLPADVKGEEEREEEEAKVEESTPAETHALERDAGVEEEDSTPQTERGDACAEEEVVANE